MPRLTRLGEAVEISTAAVEPLDIDQDLALAERYVLQLRWAQCHGVEAATHLVGIEIFINDTVGNFHYYLITSTVFQDGLGALNHGPGPHEGPLRLLPTVSEAEHSGRLVEQVSACADLRQGPLAMWCQWPG